MTSSRVLALIPPLALILLGACGRTPLDEAPDGGGGGKVGTGGRTGTGGGSAGQTGTGGVAGTGGAATGGTGTGGAGTGGAGTGGATTKPDADPPRPDGGPDALRDAREEPIHVTCPSPTTGRPRRSVRLEGMVRGPARWQASWRVVAAPSGSAVARGPFAGTSIDLVPDRVGSYSLTFEALDGRGGTSSCVADVSVRALPPMVFCPRESRATVDRELVLTGDGKDDDGPVTLRWSVSPPAATVMPVVGATTRFRAPVPGIFAVTLTATDIDGEQASCRTPVVVAPAPMAMCPPSGEKYVRMREATFAARVELARGLVTTWTLIKRPVGSQAEPNPRNGLITEIIPDVLGEYLLEFVARNLDGIESRCETSFTAVSDPPALECPDIDTTPLTDTEIAVGVSDNGEIVRWEWSLAAQPPGSAVRPMFPAGDAFTFRPDLAGDYGFTLTVTDDEALSASCKFSVRAAAEEGLRVEMFWDIADTDMDLHLLSPLAKRWFDETTGQDCFYSNCTGTSPNWSNQSSDLDDPHLDLDDTDGFGPENINVDRPGPGVYRVGVHAFSGLRSSNVTVRLYCGGSRLEPRATLGPVALPEEQVWKVADVEISADGRCEVRKLANPDGSAVVVPRASAELAR